MYTQHNRRLSRAEYETAKTNCASRINLYMQRHNLSPADIQRITTDWVIKQEEQVAITMQDIYQYRTCRVLPRHDKLKVLAKVLQCTPDDLVEKRYQSPGRIYVSRHVNQSHNDLVMKVTPHPQHPTHAILEMRVILPTQTAYKVSKQLSKAHAIEEMRRWGWSDEQIAYHTGLIEQKAAAAANALTPQQAEEEATA